MPTFKSFESLAEHFARIEARLPLVTHQALEESAELIEVTAKGEFGTYQPAVGPFPGWSVLADATLIDKWRMGYSPPDNPLVRTHEMQNSISHRTDWHGITDGVAYVGSNDSKFQFHEYGTSKMPARPVLGPALFQNIDKIKVIFRKQIQALFEGRS